MAIGVGYKPAGQPTVRPLWYRPPVEAIADTLDFRQNKYDINDAMLNKLSEQRSDLQSIEGVDRDRHKILEEKYRSLEDQIVNIAQGDLSQADFAIKDYGNLLAKDFSQTGEAGAIMGSYLSYQQILTTAQKMLSEGTINEADYWDMFQRPLEEYNAAGGVRKNYNQTKKFNKFTGKDIGPREDVSKTALELVKNWKANTNYKDISDLPPGVKIINRTWKDDGSFGYYIYETQRGEEYVDQSEVYNSLMTKFLSDDKVKAQLERDFRFQQVKGQLDGRFKKSIDDRLNEYQDAYDELGATLNSVKGINSATSLADLKKAWKNLKGVDISDYAIDRKYLYKELVKEINKLKKEQEDLANAKNTLLERQKLEPNLEKSLNLNDFMINEIEANIQLAINKETYSKDIQKTQIVSSLPPRESESSKINRAIEVASGEDDEIILDGTVTLAKDIKEDNFEKLTKENDDSVKSMVEELKSLVMETHLGSFKKDKWRALFENFNDKTIGQYIDADGDFLLTKFINDNATKLTRDQIGALRGMRTIFDDRARKIKTQAIQARRYREMQEERINIVSNNIGGNLQKLNSFEFDDIKYDNKKELNELKNLFLERKSDLPSNYSFSQFIEDYKLLITHKEDPVEMDEFHQFTEDDKQPYETPTQVAHNKRKKRLGSKATAIALKYNRKEGEKGYDKFIEFFDNLKEENKKLEKGIEDLSKKGIKEFTMSFTGFSNDLTKQMIKAADNANKFLDEKVVDMELRGVQEGTTVDEYLKQYYGIIGNKTLTGVQISESAFNGTRIWKFSYSGENAKKETKNGVVYIPDGDKFKFTSADGKNIIKPISDVDLNFESAVRTLDMVGGFGSSYIMSLQGRDFYYHKTVGGEEQIKIINLNQAPRLRNEDNYELTKEDLIPKIDYINLNEGLTAMFTLSKVNKLADKLSNNNGNLFRETGVLGEITVKDKAVNVNHLLANRIIPYIQLANNNKQAAYDNFVRDFYKNNIGQVLYLKKGTTNYSSMAELSKNLIIAEPGLTNSKYIPVFNFNELSISDINSFFSDTNLQFKEHKKKYK
jgi:hypothetical protein